MKTFLLTGSTGYLGSHLLDAMLKKYSCILLNRRSSKNREKIDKYLPYIKEYFIDECSFDDIFKNEEIHGVIHAATTYDNANINTSSIIQSNLLLPITLLEAAEKSGVKNFYNIDTVLNNNLNRYSKSKSQFRDYVEHIKPKMSITHIRLEHMYGPGDNNKFIPMLIDKMKRDAPIDLTRGVQELDFIYIDDVVSGIMTILDDNRMNVQEISSVDLGSGSTITLKEFVEMLKDKINSNSELHFGSIPYRKHEKMKSKADTSYLQKLGWAPKFSINEGIKKMVVYYDE